MVASNLFGDVISDAFAGLIGGLGFAASGNIGDEVAVFEPTHGSAPKYAELDPPIVNPIAMFLSAVMMLEHVGEVEKARRIRDAIAAVVKEGKVRTYDMMRIPGGANAISQGAASTMQMTDAVLDQAGTSRDLAVRSFDAGVERENESPNGNASTTEIRDENLDDPRALPQKLLALLNGGIRRGRRAVRLFLTPQEEIPRSRRTRFSRSHSDMSASSITFMSRTISRMAAFLRWRLLGRGIGLRPRIGQPRLTPPPCCTKHFRIIVASRMAVSVCTVRFHTDQARRRLGGIKTLDGFKEVAIR